jgi:hypothetical protein
MNKTFILVTFFCFSFTAWWAWELDSGPFIYRHTAPDKLSNKISSTFMPYFVARDIKSIRFGRKNLSFEDSVPVDIASNKATEKWLTPNKNTGPVLILIELDKEALSLYWNVPQDLPFDDSYNIIAQALWDILYQYDQIVSVQNTYH